jgi:CBS domain-containing protein
MAAKIRDVMAPRPVAVPPTCTLAEAARQMRDGDIGDVMVQDGSRLQGIVTDRDIVVRAVADDRAPSSVTVGEICSSELVTVGPDDLIDKAVELMRRAAVRRLPVVDAGQAVGVVSLGDLALARDPSSALAEISGADRNI